MIKFILVNYFPLDGLLDFTWREHQEFEDLIRSNGSSFIKLTQWFSRGERKSYPLLLNIDEIAQISGIIVDEKDYSVIGFKERSRVPLVVAELFDQLRDELV